MDRVYCRRFYGRRFNESEWTRTVLYQADFLNSGHCYTEIIVLCLVKRNYFLEDFKKLS